MHFLAIRLVPYSWSQRQYTLSTTLFGNAAKFNFFCFSISIFLGKIRHFHCDLYIIKFVSGIFTNIQWKCTVSTLIKISTCTSDQFCLSIFAYFQDGAQMLDLISFWTGGSTLQSGIDSLLVKFDGGANLLPLSETCFRTIVLPTKHTTYDDFKKHMDIACKFGSTGFSFTWLSIIIISTLSRSKSGTQSVKVSSSSGFPAKIVFQILPFILLIYNQIIIIFYTFYKKYSGLQHIFYFYFFSAKLTYMCCFNYTPKWSY